MGRERSRSRFGVPFHRATGSGGRDATATPPCLNWYRRGGMDLSLGWWPPTTRAPNRSVPPPPRKRATAGRSRPVGPRPPPPPRPPTPPPSPTPTPPPALPPRHP